MAASHRRESARSCKPVTARRPGNGGSAGISRSCLGTRPDRQHLIARRVSRGARCAGLWSEQSRSQFPESITGEGIGGACRLCVLPRTGICRDRDGGRSPCGPRGRRYSGAASSGQDHLARGGCTYGCVLCARRARGHDRQHHRRERRQLLTNLEPARAIHTPIGPVSVVRAHDGSSPKHRPRRRVLDRR